MTADRRLSPGGVVVYRKTRVDDAIDEYSRSLVDALRSIGCPVAYVPDGLGEVAQMERAPAWILLQYMAFSYGRWGFAPGLVRDALVLKRNGVLVAVMVHEAWVPMTDWRTCTMGAYQRLQLRSLLRLADVVVVSIEAFAVRFGGGAVHLPVGSTISPTDVTRDAARRAVGIRDELVVTLFGTGHPHRALEHAEAALAALVAARGPEGIRVLLILVPAPRRYWCRRSSGWIRPGGSRRKRSLGICALATCS